MKYIFGLVLVLFISGCSTKEDFVLFYNDLEGVNDKDEAVNTIPVEKIKFEYKIMPHDRISLIIYKHPEFSTTRIGAASEDKGLLVDSDGDVYLPLVDSVHVAGLTQKEAKDKIEKSFSNFLQYSKVKLEVLNKRVYVMGEVKKPGEIELINEQSSLLRMIAKAGDFTDFANRKNVFVLRDVRGETVMKRINLVDIHAIALSSLQIFPNDIIYIPAKGSKAFNARVGEYAPIFSLLGSILTPFVNIKYLTGK